MQNFIHIKHIKIAHIKNKIIFSKKAGFCSEMKCKYVIYKLQTLGQTFVQAATLFRGKPNLI
jgi:hypothetical protein